MSFEISGANISKNNIRWEALAFLGLILIDLSQTIELTKNVDGNILEIILAFLDKKLRVFSSGLLHGWTFYLRLACISSTLQICTSAAFVWRHLSLSNSLHMFVYNTSR